MKKLLTLSVAVMALTSSAAMADTHMDKDHDVKHHYKESMFEVYDLNNDGEITGEEFKAYNELEYTEIDVNEDGSITIEEYNNMQNNNRFKRLDADNSGVVTMEEAKASKELWKARHMKDDMKKHDKKGM